jgi:hypothetical protein
MLRNIGLAVGVGILLTASTACGPRIDLTKLVVADTFTGWYDNGVKDGLNQMVPSLTFRLENTGTVPANHVQLSISFWMDGADGEYDGREVVGIGADPVPPGGSTEPILVRAAYGFTLEQPRAELFNHSQFRDVTARILAKRDGKIVRIGEVRIDRRLIPRVYDTAAQP